MWIFRTGKNGRTKAPEPESRRDGQVPGQAEAGAAQQALAEEPEGCRRRIMKIKNWRRYLSVPTGNRSAAIRRETPWVRERPKPGVQAAWAMEPAAARVQTAQARKRPGPEGGQQPSRAMGARPRGPEERPGNWSGRYQLRHRGGISSGGRLQHYFRLGGVKRAGKGEHRRRQIPAHGHSVAITRAIKNVR